MVVMVVMSRVLRGGGGAYGLDRAEANLGLGI